MRGSDDKMSRWAVYHEIISPMLFPVEDAPNNPCTVAERLSSTSHGPSIMLFPTPGLSQRVVLDVCLRFRNVSFRTLKLGKVFIKFSKMSIVCLYANSFYHQLSPQSKALTIQPLISSIAISQPPIPNFSSPSSCITLPPSVTTTSPIEDITAS